VQDQTESKEETFKPIITRRHSIRRNDRIFPGWNFIRGQNPFDVAIPIATSLFGQAPRFCIDFYLPLDLLSNYITLQAVPFLINYHAESRMNRRSPEPRASKKITITFIQTTRVEHDLRIHFTDRSVNYPRLEGKLTVVYTIRARYVYTGAARYTLSTTISLK